MKQSKKAARRRGPLGIMFVAVIMAGLGVGLAAATLVVRPVPEVSRVPDSPERGVAYFVRGDPAETKGNDVKMANLAEGLPGEYVFSEGDLTSWARTNLLPAPQTKDAQVRLNGSPNVRLLENGKAQVTLRVEFPGIAKGRVFIYQSVGSLDNDGFHPFNGWFGQCPLPGVNAMLFDAIAGKLETTEQAENIATVLEEAEVSVKDRQLIVSL